MGEACQVDALIAVLVKYAPGSSFSSFPSVQGHICCCFILVRGCEKWASLLCAWVFIPDCIVCDNVFATQSRTSGWTSHMPT
jgi:hypothetical protein